MENKIDVYESLRPSQNKVVVDDSCLTESTFDDENGRFALFCRAIDEQDEDAWADIQGHYQSLVKCWIRTRVQGISDFDLDDLVQGVYTKFWGCLTKIGCPFTEKFPHIGAILKYLKQCAFTTAYDYLRTVQKLNLLDDRLYLYSAQGEPFTQIQVNEDAESVQRVRLWVSEKLQDPTERLLIKLMFEYDLKPAEISAQFPNHFPQSADVNRIRERVLKRARRAFIKTAVVA